ncbi:MAG TPA: lysophospholipid acyltransferase family protein [Pirellulales bacterium]|nr:lysophospholipid acyltransferase family protein [Pirellulales bacterium]
MSIVAQYLGYLAVRIFVCSLQALRMETCQMLAAGLATLAGEVLRLRRKVVEDNLRLAFPDLSDEDRRRLAWRMWEHLFILIVEIAHAPRKIHETNWRRFVRFKNNREFGRLLLNGRPLIVTSAHFGNFEMAGYILAILGFPTYTVARPLDNPFLDAFLNRFRGHTGQHIIPKKGGYEKIVEVLASGGHMTFLADQYAGSKGCWVEFFGRPASVHKAIALFALNHDAPLMVGYGQRLEKPMCYELALEASVDPRGGDDAVSSVPRLTQWYTSQFETIIRRAPEQYWWLHRRWKDTRPAKRKLKKAA